MGSPDRARAWRGKWDGGVLGRPWCLPNALRGGEAGSPPVHWTWSLERRVTYRGAPGWRVAGRRACPWTVASWARQGCPLVQHGRRGRPQQLAARSRLRVPLLPGAASGPPPGAAPPQALGGGHAATARPTGLEISRRSFRAPKRSPPSCGIDRRWSTFGCWRGRALGRRGVGWRSHGDGEIVCAQTLGRTYSVLEESHRPRFDRNGGGRC